MGKADVRILKHVSVRFGRTDDFDGWDWTNDTIAVCIMRVALLLLMSAVKTASEMHHDRYGK